MPGPVATASAGWSHWSRQNWMWDVPPLLMAKGYSWNCPGLQTQGAGDGAGCGGKVSPFSFHYRCMGGGSAAPGSFPSGEGAPAGSLRTQSLLGCEGAAAKSHTRGTVTGNALCPSSGGSGVSEVQVWAGLPLPSPPPPRAGRAQLLAAPSGFWQPQAFPGPAPRIFTSSPLCVRVSTSRAPICVRTPVLLARGAHASDLPWHPMTSVKTLFPTRAPLGGRGGQGSPCPWGTRVSPSDPMTASCSGWHFASCLFLSSTKWFSNGVHRTGSFYTWERSQQTGAAAAATRTNQLAASAPPPFLWTGAGSEALPACVPGCGEHACFITNCMMWRSNPSGEHMPSTWAG